MYRHDVKLALRADCASTVKKAGLVVLAGVLLAAAAAAAASTVLERRQDASFHSSALGGSLHYEVYLPADYRTMTRDPREGDLLPEHLAAQQRLNGGH